MNKTNPPPKLVSTRVVYEQDMDNCGDIKDDRQRLTMETFDGGGGTYVVISTERWAVDPGDMDWIAERVQSLCKGKD